MGTRAAAFTAKIRNLHDYRLRLLHGVMPVPSGVDVGNTLKYFSQTLLTVLKDVPSSPIEMLKFHDKDAARMALFPSLDYKGLYNVIVELLDVAPLIQYGLQTFGQSLLQCLGCLVPFLEHDLIDTLPYLVASSMAVFPSALHQQITNLLCYHVLPFSLKNEERQDNYASQSAAAVIMMVFQYSDNTAHHCQLLECLMSMKENVVTDLLSVIAHGTTSARASAAKLLFYYWPTPNSSIFDRKSNLVKLTGNWAPFVCQREHCANAGNVEAAKVCYDHCISITFASDSSPPLYLCIECANEIHREHPNQTFCDILHQLQQPTVLCENKNCRATDKTAVSICFSIECASYNGNHPIRYCQQCHNIRHNNRRGGDHIVHQSLPSLQEMNAEMQSYIVEAIVSLLKESQPYTVDYNKDADIHAKSGLLNVLETTDNISLEERQLLGQCGVWLLVGLCAPNSDTNVDMLGRLLSMLFHWFDVTSYSLHDQSDNAVEKLKTEFVGDWLTEIRKTHFEVVVNCLLPHPPDYARVGGHWETLASRTSHLKDGLNRLFCLVPYDVITPEVWDFVMPHWMEAMVNDVPEKELLELKILLSKMLDPDMSPLGFDAKKMYRFIAVRFKKTTAKVQEQALSWLQILCELEIVIPLSHLFLIFGDGVKIMKNVFKDSSEKPTNKLKNEETLRRSSISPVVEDESGNTSPFSDDDVPVIRHKEFETDAEVNLPCCILMLDVLLRQMELQNVDKHTGIYNSMTEDLTKLLRIMVSVPWIGSHTCSEKNECTFCESCVMWYQLAVKLIEYVAPESLAHPPDPRADDHAADDSHGRKTPPDSDKKPDSKPSDVVITMPMSEIHTVGGVLVNMPQFIPLQIMTATVETVSELDLAPIIPSEKVVKAVARAVTITETDTATATVQVAKATLVGENDQPIDVGEDEDDQNFWHTSVGKFRFAIEELPQQLQFIHQLLKELPNVEEPDILYHMLECLYILILHGDALTKAAKDHRGFVIWCQENLLVKNLWNLLSADRSHMAEVCVPILLHCITLPCGSDVYWKLIEDEFHNPDWKVRFIAAERVTVTARFMDSTPLKSNQSLQSALANAFCYLISSMDDVNVQVAQRATLYLGTIHDQAMKSLIMCLESQFDSVIIDRPMVLQSLYQLHNGLSDRKILTWDFFLNRFDALFLEAQINLEKCGDISYMRDLRNTDLNSEVFIRKLHRAHEALTLSQTDGTSMKTLSASFGTKWPYKRTMSAPASMAVRQEKQEKEKVYNRQSSAPILKRKSSRFGLDGHIHSLNSAEDGNLVAFLHRVIDFEEADRETMHLLVFLLMQFLSRSDQAFPTEDKTISKTQNIVLRHLYLLLGYNQNERGFHVPPQRLRTSPVFSAFLSTLPQLLDQNHHMGSMLLPTSLILLQYCPSPHHSTTEFQQPTYGLWFLEPYARRNWLMSLVVILYKYQYDQLPLSSQIPVLVRIVLNTLDSQHHQCKRIPATVVMGPPPCRSRDVSQASLGTDGEHSLEKFETPPLSPMFSSDGTRVTISTKSSRALFHKTHSFGMGTHWEEGVDQEEKFSEAGPLGRKMPDSSFSIDADDIDPELAAIPESPKSDSTLHESPQGSIGELVSLEETIIAEQACVCIEDGQGEELIMVRPTFALPQDAKVVVESSPQVVEPHSVQQVRATASVVNHGLEEPPRPSWYLEGDEDETQMCGALSSPDSICMATSVQVQEPFGAQQKHFPFNEDSNGGNKPPETLGLLGYRGGSPVPRPLGHRKRPDPKPAATLSPYIPWQIEVHPSIKVPQLPAPSPERLLPIGSGLSGPKSLSQPIKAEDTIGSPESPLSKMDIITVDNHMADDLVDTRESEAATPVISQTLDPFIKYESYEKHSIQKGMRSPGDDVQHWHSSPKRLVKQGAVDMLPPPLHVEGDEPRAPFYRKVQSDRKHAATTAKAEDHIHSQRQRQRKTGLFTMDQHSFSDYPRRPGSWYGSRLQPQLDPASQQACHASFDLKQSAFRVGDECVHERCSECGTIKEEYSDEDLGLCIVILGTFIHREPALAAPLLPEILRVVAKIALNATYPWQNETNIYLPGGAVSVAHQFVRCVLHQLAPNGVFIQMFQTQVDDSTRMQFFRSVAQALLDFNELNPIAPLQLLLEGINSKKSLPVETLPTILHNVACYLDCLPLETGVGPGFGPGAGSSTWSALLTQLEALFRRLVLVLNSLEEMTPLLRIMTSVLKVPGIAGFKGILDPFSKVMSYTIQNFVMKYQNLVDLCHLCNRGFTREREKLLLTRMVVFELVQALKFKSSIPDSNFLMLINFVLQDAGGSLPLNVVMEDNPPLCPDTTPQLNTNSSECMRQHLGDALEFLADFHTLSKIKSYCKGMAVGLNEDTLGGVLKSGIAQYLALEITRGNSRDNRAVSRYLPWLYNAPSALQQGPREFIDCVGHIRLLSWLLLGSLTHTALLGTSTTPFCQPVPQEASCHIADHIQVILAGFAEQSKASVLHMSSLFHAFILCQLWTVYLEQSASTNPPTSEPHAATMSILSDFWGKVTPCILQLVSHSKVLAEMVNLHFLSLLEALLECNSTVLSRLLPVWSPVLFAFHTQLPGNLQVRLQGCRNYPPSTVTSSSTSQHVSNPVLLRWLQRLQFKMGQIELQSSAATQFYSV